MGSDYSHLERNGGVPRLSSEELPQRVPNQLGTRPYAGFGDPIEKILGKDVNSLAGTPGYEGAPAHYKGNDGIQVFDVWDAYDMDRYRAAAFKYFGRYKVKGSMDNDLRKLMHYLQEALNRLPSETEDFLNMEDIELTPARVLDAFDLDGIMGDAAIDFLLSFTVRHPRTYLRSALAQVAEYVLQSSKM